MAVTVERLIATLEARFDKYERSLDKALGKTNRQFTAIERRGRQLESRMASIGGNIGRRFVAALAAGISVRAFQQLSDAATRIDNALKVAGLSGDELEKVYGRLRDSAVRNAAPLETLVELYGRAAMAAGNLGASQEDLVKFADNVAVSLRVAGKSSTEAAGALLQLSQLLSGSVVQAQEYNSLIDGAYPLLQAVAAGLKEAGGDVGRLTQLVKAGEVPTKAFFGAFQAGAPILEQKVANAEFTVSQALGNLRTSLIDAVREFNNATGASGSFAEGINNVAQVIADFDISGFIQKIKDAHDEFARFWGRIANSPGMERFAEVVTGTELTVGKPISLETVEAQKELANLERKIGILTDRIEANKEMEIDTSEAQAQLNDLIGRADALRARLSAPAAGGTGRGFVGSPELPGNQPKRAAPVTITPVSLSDFAPPSGKGGKGGGRGREDSLAREIRQIQERTAAIQAETAAQAGLNPLIDDYGYALERARAVQELLSAAKKEGIAVTPELRTQIDALAEGYAQATVEANRLAEEQDRVRQAAEDMRALGKDVLGGFIRDLSDGKSAADALSNALGKIADKLLDMALNNLFSGGLFGGKGGLLGGFLIPGILHSGGVAGQDGYGHGRKVSPGVFAGAHRYHSGGIAGLRPGEVPAILQRGEIVLPRGAGKPAAGGDKRVTIHQTFAISGAVSSRDVQAMVRQGAAQAVDEVKRNLHGWSIQLGQDGAVA